MSQDIIFEVNFFLHSFLLGIIITFVYDWFLILRRIVRHHIFVISLEDLIFWLACALGVFYVLYRENNGILRWFAVLGAGIGMWMYKKVCSTFFVNMVSSCILKIFCFIIRPITFIVKKIVAIFSWIKKKVHILLKFVIKKLTIQLKLIKIILCKQKEKKEIRRGKKNSAPQKAPE